MAPQATRTIILTSVRVTEGDRERKLKNMTLIIVFYAQDERAVSIVLVSVEASPVTLTRKLL